MAPLKTITVTRTRSTSSMLVAVALFAGAAALAFMAAPKLAGSANAGYKAKLADNTHVTNFVFKDIKMGGRETCVLKFDGTVWCWGDNSYGQLGVSPTLIQSSANPVQVMDNNTPLTNVVSLSVNKHTKDAACVLKTDGTVWCWGNGIVQSNPATFSSSPVPMQMSPGVPVNHVTYLDVSRNFCFVKDDGSAWCWGRDRNGDGTDQLYNYPVRILDENRAPLTNAKTISSGYENTCVTSGQNVLSTRCFGDNDTNGLGDGTKNRRLLPNYVLDNNNLQFSFFGVIKLAIGDYHTCAIDVFGSVACWGQCDIDKTPYFMSNQWAMIKPGDGNCSVGARYFPDGIGKIFNPIVGLASGAVHTCAIKADGTVWCWGWNASNQLGNINVKVNSWKTPVQVVQQQGNGFVPFSQVTNIEAGVNSTCAITNYDTVYCWGNNSWSVLGNGCNNFQCNWPVKVTF